MKRLLLVTGLVLLVEPLLQAEEPNASAGLIPLLQEKVRQLTAEGELLQAKLKEALSAQPAAVDPRELARANEKIKSLEKEIDVLKVNLEKAESRPDRRVDPSVLEETRKDLGAAKQKLAEQTEMSAVLTLAKEALETRLQAFINGAEIKSLRDEIESLKRQVHDLKVEAGAKPDAEESAGSQRGLTAKVLGTVKLRQGNYDEAFVALSRAAELDPQDADVFASLGVVLAEKGLREPAESAFRRAIQLAPGHADAHRNLALIYATQRTPALELARWHYQKSLAGGHARDSKLERMLKR